MIKGSSSSGQKMRTKIHGKKQRSNCEFSRLLSRSTSNSRREIKTKLCGARRNLKAQRTKMRTKTAKLSELWPSKRPKSSHAYLKLTKVPLG